MEKLPLPEVLQHGSITLRKHDPDRAPEMFALVDGDRMRLRQFLPWVDATRSPADTKAYILDTLAKRELGTLFDYSIFFRNQYVGNIGVHSISWDNERAELGYWIAGAHEGHGCISNAARALEGACFAAGFHRIEIHCNATNARSAAVPQRLGYTLEGTLRDHTIEYGQRRTTLLFAKLNAQSAKK